MTTREAFLERISAEVRRARPAFEASATPRPARPREAAELVRRQMAERWPEALRRFEEEFSRVGGTFHRVRRRQDVAGVVLGIARAQGTRELVSWAQDALGVDLGAQLGAHSLHLVPAGTTDDRTARAAHRDTAARAGIGVTGADIVLAETGTIIVMAGTGRPRATSLLPPTHVAVFDRSQLVESLEQVGVLLEDLNADGRAPAAINFITGPSRTADIELTLTRGVHGPKEVHAVFVEEP
jgi:L-lactate dehydrogenase complex protein LldG